MQQFRLDSLVSFNCVRCGQPKKSKLVTVYSGDWSRLLCNGCYGRLLSIYDIKAGTEPTDAKADELAQVLLSFVTLDQVRLSEKKVILAERRAAYLSSRSLQFLATSDYVAQSLDDRPSLDWSPAIIGLCKAFEIELDKRVIDPLKQIAEGVDLSVDINDKDLGRVAKYCAGQMSIPPELGVVRHFFATAATRRIAQTVVQFWSCSGNSYQIGPMPIG